MPPKETEAHLREARTASAERIEQPARRDGFPKWRRADIIPRMARRYWLIKSEPFKYAWERFVTDGRTH